MEKKCVYCNEFLDIKLHGLTKYCSAKCRNKDYYIKKKTDNTQISDYEPAEKELPNSINSSSIEQDRFIGNNDSIRANYESPKQVQIKKEEFYFPETYKAILDEKSRNFELLSKLNMLEYRNEELIKRNNLLESEVSTLESELDQDSEKGKQIFGMPKEVIENIIIQVLTPHAGKIIDGFTKKD